MRTKLFIAYYVIAWFTIEFTGRNVFSVEPATPAVTTTGNLYGQLENDRNRLWISMIKDAGRTNGGLSLAASLSRPSFAPGEKIELKLYVRNVSEVPTSYNYDRYHPSIPVVFLHDERGNPVKLSAGRINGINEVFAFSSDVIISMSPGEAFSTSYAVSNYFELKKPGRYTILAAMRGGQGGLVVAKPIEFILNQKAAAIGEGKIPAPSAVPAAASPKVAVRAGDEWNVLMKMAGLEIDGRILDCVLSPYSPNAVHLVTSLTCVRNTNRRQLGPFDPDGNCTVRFGRVPSNYRILIHDSSGQPVPMTRFGRDFFQRQFQEFPCDVPLGSSVGTWLPLDELFCLKSGADYTILAMLAERPGSSAGLVSPVIKIHVPQLPVPGLTRPPYGSNEIWKKIVARAKAPDPILVLSFDGTPNNLDRIPRITLRNRSGKAFEGDLSTIETTLLVRDPRGDPILPLAIEGDNHDDEIAKVFPAMTEALKASRRLDTTPFRPIEEEVRPPAEINTVVAFPKFPHGYPIIPGQPYTIVVGAQTRGDHPAFVTAGPLIYVPQSEFDFRVHDGEDSRAQSSRTSLTARDGTLDLDSLNRFAGVPFGDLVMHASEDKPGELKLSLWNKGIRSIVVKKWEGAAGYNVQVRNAVGKLIPLTETGKGRFEGGSFLESHELRPHDKIEVNLPISGLFEMKGKGEYTILASLPLIGDVDAVLTAAPVKMRFDVKPATRMK